MNKNRHTTKNKCIWQKVLIMKMVAINIIRSKLKTKRFKIPNAPYSNRSLNSFKTVGCFNLLTVTNRELDYRSSVSIV